MSNREQKIKATARKWLLRMSLGSPTEHDRAQCAAWCAEDARHAATYHRYESIWHDAARLDELRSFAALPPARTTWWWRARVGLRVHPLRWASSAAVAIAAVGIGFWFVLAPAHYAAPVAVAFTPTHYATGIAELRDIHLSDGSEITLGARSSLEVDFRPHERRVSLTSGVAFFSVAKNPSRPFLVRVGDKEVRDLGTEFEIRRGSAGMRVSVVEGKVEVMNAPIPNGAPTLRLPLTASGSPEERNLSAGQQVTTGFADGIPEPHAMPPGTPAAWRYGRLVYVNMPLKDIIGDINRYSREPIELADERVANVRISATCPSDRIGEMVAALSHSLSLEIERPKSGDIVLKARGPGG